MRKPLIALLLAIPTLTCASPLSSQLNAVAAAEQQGVKEEASRQAQEEAARQAHLRHEQAVAAQRQHAAAQARLKREQQQLAAQREAHQERMADKQREQSYQDQLRQIELENMKMEMDARSWSCPKPVIMPAASWWMKSRKTRCSWMRLNDALKSATSPPSATPFATRARAISTSRSGWEAGLRMRARPPQTRPADGLTNPL